MSAPSAHLRRGGGGFRGAQDLWLLGARGARLLGAGDFWRIEARDVRLLRV
ncbi:Hypothetical protein CAP_2512 [Chondromyces apiculatus DSM 436]|uniref:Uncharacterized protein n=1 Tax=Chondromyces apiculatus DSM 436 TaxID=1192034 RepID=A0A017TID8_9BACT|nr:Hypothetical protein CAP_2512 [Chondromyces apiculatus DSM 436]